MRFLAVSVLCVLIMPVAAQEAPSSFNKCLPCHAIGEGAINKVGPQLNGLLGHPAGGEGGYSYSQAMQTARADGLEWSRETLTQYLKRPKHFMPGTSMSFAGMTHRDEIDAIIDYLASFDSDGTRLAP